MIYGTAFVFGILIVLLIHRETKAEKDLKKLSEVVASLEEKVNKMSINIQSEDK